MGTSGTYTATLNPNQVIANGIELLTGVFSPSVSTPTTPLSNFFAATQNVSTTTVLSGVPLTAGTQYSYLLLFNPSSGTATFTISGPGCISFGSNTCQNSVPAITPEALAALAIMIAGIAAYMMMKRPSAHSV